VHLSCCTAVMTSSGGSSSDPTSSTKSADSAVRPLVLASGCMVTGLGSAGGAMVPRGCPSSSLLAIHKPVRAHRLDAYLLESGYVSVHAQITYKSVCPPVSLPVYEPCVNLACMYCVFWDVTRPVCVCIQSTTCKLTPDACSPSGTHLKAAHQ